MNWAYAHLALNHIPVLGVPFGLALLCAGALRRSDELKKAALWAFAAVAILAPCAYFTGEPAEDVVHGLPGVSGPAIEEHEEAAGFALAAVETLGALSLVALFLSRGRRSLATWLLVATLLLALASSILMARTAHLGGQVHHPEIRDSAGEPSWRTEPPGR